MFLLCRCYYAMKLTKAKGVPTEIQSNNMCIQDH